MTLTKRDLVIRISGETGLTQQQIFDVVQKTLDYISEALAKGDKVELRNFGVFEVVERRPRIARNPKAAKREVLIPARKVVKFKPGKVMEDRITVPSMKGGIQPVHREKKTDESPRIPGEASP